MLVGGFPQGMDQLLIDMDSIDFRSKIVPQTDQFLFTVNMMLLLQGVDQVKPFIQHDQPIWIHLYFFGRIGNFRRNIAQFKVYSIQSVQEGRNFRIELCNFCKHRHRLLDPDRGVPILLLQMVGGCQQGRLDLLGMGEQHQFVLQLFLLSDLESCLGELFQLKLKIIQLLA